VKIAINSVMKNTIIVMMIVTKQPYE